MTDWTNTCEGSSGTTVTTSNTAGPTQFDTINTPCVFDSAQAAHGSTSLKFDGTIAQYVIWQASLTGSPFTNFYVRVYVYLTGSPTANSRLINLVTAAGTVCGTVQVTTGRILRLVNGAGSVVATGTTTVPLNQWVRVEFDVTGVSGTTGNYAERLYLSDDSATSDETLTATGTTVNAGPSRAWFGPSSAAAGTAIWMDDIGASDTVQLAPAGGTGTNTSPAYATAASDLGGGSGSWVNPGNADGAADSTYATWTAP